MKVGIIGYEGSGKTTIFGALSGADPAELLRQKQQIREVRVPDKRIDALSAMYQPKKTIYATIQFVDVMSGAAIGKGLDGSILGRFARWICWQSSFAGFRMAMTRPTPSARHRRC